MISGDLLYSFGLELTSRFDTADLPSIGGLCAENGSFMRSRPLSIPSIALLFVGLILVFTSRALAAGDEDGADLYQFYCSTCHGDVGQGLTDEFRATWPEGEQNCWQSKCHIENHPPEGFILPTYVPAIIGETTLAKFRSANDLFVYARAAMPYYKPGRLTDDEYLAITQYLVTENYSARGYPAPTGLDGDLQEVSLHPGGIPEVTPVVVGPTATSPADELIAQLQAPTPAGEGSNPAVDAPEPQPWRSLTLVYLSLAGLGILGAGGFLWFYKRKN
jgi:mono/diheme cytochrome c family protein